MLTGLGDPGPADGVVHVRAQLAGHPAQQRAEGGRGPVEHPLGQPVVQRRDEEQVDDEPDADADDGVEEPVQEQLSPGCRSRR